MSRLLIVYRTGLETIVRKGEIVPRYFNPGEVFNEVHIVALNRERPDPTELQKMVGGARLVLHNLPPPTALKVGVWPPAFRLWVRRGVALAQSIQPDLVRVYGCELEGFMATRLKAALSVPMVLSLHTNRDAVYRETGRPRIDRWLIARLVNRSTREVLHAADEVLPVYKPIVPYLEKHGIRRYKVIYNAVGHGLVPKQNYELNRPARLICVGRFERSIKDPTNIVRGMAELPDTKLTFVGDGPLSDTLANVAQSVGVADRVELIRAMPNARLLELLQEQDIFVFHSTLQLSKIMMEASLAGLPIVTNLRLRDPEPRFTEDEVALHVDDSPEGYAEAVRRLLGDQSLREELGRKARSFAEATFHPTDMERKAADVYRTFVAGSPAEGVAGAVAR